MDIKVRQFLDYITLEKRYSAHTVESYHTDLVQFCEFLDDLGDGRDISWNLLERKHIRFFLMHLQEKGLGKRSIARKVATLKSFLKYLEQNKVIDGSLASVVRMPRFEQKLPQFLSEKEIADIVNCPPADSFDGVRDKAILELLYGCGLRLSELINLQMQDLLLSQETIRIMGKGKKERFVPVGRKGKAALLRYLDLRPSRNSGFTENVFILKNGKKMYPMAIQRMVKKYIEQVVSGVSAHPHMLRHSYATHLMNAGANIRVVKDLLGHENLSTTQVYTHLSVDHLKKVYLHAHPRARKK